MATRFENFAMLNKAHGFPTINNKQSKTEKQKVSSLIDWNPFMAKVLSKYDNLKNARASNDLDCKSTATNLNGSDSGYGSSPSMNCVGKQSRWAKMSESLLHNDTKAFLKKNISSPSNSEAHKPRHAFSTKKCFAFVDDNSDDEEEFNKEMLKNVRIASKKLLKSVITKNLLMMCDSISDFVNMLQFIECTVYNYESMEIELKALFKMVDPSELLQKVVCLIKGFNLTDLSKAIYEMEIACALRDLPIDNFEAECGDLKTAIDMLCNYAIRFSNYSSNESSIALIKVICNLSRTFDSITTRLWILCSLIQNA